MGKYVTVHPNSGDILDIVARSVTVNLSKPSPNTSTNLPTTPVSLNILVMDKTISVAVHPAGISPVSFSPITCGQVKYTGCPSIAASASIPPTPHPRTPIPFTIGVWEPVPTKVSGTAQPSRPTIPIAKYSKFTWWQIPIPGGTTVKLSNPCWAHFSS